MGLMMLGAAMGDTITISATGLGAEQAVEQLADAGRGALPRGREAVPRQITAFSNPLVKQARGLARQEEPARARGCSSPRGCGS